MNRIVAIVVLVASVVLLALSFASPSLTPLRGSGGFGLFVGLVLLGVSFVKPPAQDKAAPPEMSLGARLMGIFLEPSAVFQNLRWYPRWGAAVIIAALVFSVYQMAFIQRVTPEAIANKLSDNIIKSSEGFGAEMPPAQKLQMREDQLKAYKTPAGRVSLVLSLLLALCVSALLFGALYLLLTMAFGGKMNYWQGVAAAAYTTLPITVLVALLSLIILFIKSASDISIVKGLNYGLVTADLGVLFDAAKNPVLYTAASIVGLFSVYSLWLTATGLRHASTKLSNASAWGIAITLFVIGCLLRLAAAALFPSWVG